MSPQNQSDKLITTIIVVVGVIGLLYFGWQAVFDRGGSSDGNPFEYNIDLFVQDGSDNVNYEPDGVINLAIEKPSAVAINRHDTLFVAGNGTLILFAPDGNQLAAYEIAGQATCMAVDHSNLLYVGLTSQIEVLDIKGKRKAMWRSVGENAILTSITVSESFVYAADAGQKLVWKLDKSGNVMARMGEENPQKDIDGFVIPSPYFDVAIDPDGFLWAVNTGRHQFENYYPNGDLRSTWARTSMGVDGFSGCCNPSHIAILEDGSFVTSEKGIPRVKIHNLNGDFVTMVAPAQLFDEGTVGLDLAVDSRQRIFVLDPHRRQVRIFRRKEGV